MTSPRLCPPSARSASRISSIVFTSRSSVACISLSITGAESGALPLETFVTLVDEELALAKARTKKKGRKKASYYKTWVLDVGATEAPWEPVGVTP